VYVYIASSSGPYVKVTLDAGPYAAALQQVFDQVPFPSYAKPSSGSDERMSILQPSTGCFWDFWHLYQATDGSGWHAGWGGRMCKVFSNYGVYQNVDDRAGNILEQNNWGGPATGFPGGSGAMMVDELAHGTIRHAIAFALDAQANCSGVWSQPAERTDGLATPVLDATGEPTNCVPEGARFRLPPPCPAGTASTPGVCYNLSDLAGDPPIITEMAAAAQTYGLIDENSTQGGTVGVESADAQSPPYLVLGGNPYTTAMPHERNTPFLGDYTNPSALALFPWSWLELVQMNVTNSPNPNVYTQSDPPSPIWPN
jgi:hypothetical protein